MTEIVRIGREQLATDGPAALSLRAVARDLGVVSSAVYRYVASRDALLTLLVVDAYDELGDAVDAALASAPASEPATERYPVLAGAFRDWAVREPSRYGLVYGTPVPGYVAPQDTVTTGTRVVLRLLGLLADGLADGSVSPNGPAVEPRLAGQLAAIRSSDIAGAAASLPDPVLLRGVAVWAQLVGAVSLDVFGWYGADTFTDPEALFAGLVADQVRQLRAGGPD